VKDINTLIDKYPTLLENLSFGIECGNGWFYLLDRLCEDIIKIDGTCVATQIKEKFGTLRFYCDAANDEVYDLIDNAEEESRSICEECGEPGQMTGTTWYKTLCQKCYHNFRIKYYKENKDYAN